MPNFTCPHCKQTKESAKYPVNYWRHREKFVCYDCYYMRCNKCTKNGDDGITMMDEISPLCYDCHMEETRAMTVFVNNSRQICASCKQRPIYLNSPHCYQCYNNQQHHYYH